MADLSSREPGPASPPGNAMLTVLKLLASAFLFYSAGTSFAETYQQSRTNAAAVEGQPLVAREPDGRPQGYDYAPTTAGSRRRLTDVSISKKNPPSYMSDLVDELAERKKLMEETPPEEVKYWFEYTGPLQVRAALFRASANLYSSASEEGFQQGVITLSLRSRRRLRQKKTKRPKPVGTLRLGTNYHHRSQTI